MSLLRLGIESKLQVNLPLFVPNSTFAMIFQAIYYPH